MHELFFGGNSSTHKKIWSVTFKTISFSFVVVAAAAVLYVMTILPQSMIVVVVFSQSTKNDTKNCCLVATIHISVHIHRHTYSIFNFHAGSMDGNLFLTYKFFKKHWCENSKMDTFLVNCKDLKKKLT